MRRYESVVILDPELSEDLVKEFTEKYGNLVKSRGGEIVKISDWGRKRLAYPVRKREAGRFVLFDFLGAPSVINEVERNFKIADEVMKFLTVKLDDKADMDALMGGAKEEAVEPPPEGLPADAAPEEAATDAGQEPGDEPPAAVPTDAGQEPGEELPAVVPTDAGEAPVPTEPAPTQETKEGE
ncbi:MAG: 30S ribosomal protein S6 [Pseudomonadota bacterium]